MTYHVFALVCQTLSSCLLMTPEKGVFNERAACEQELRRQVQVDAVEKQKALESLMAGGGHFVSMCLELPPGYDPAAHGEEVKNRVMLRANLLKPKTEKA